VVAHFLFRAGRPPQDIEYGIDIEDTHWQVLLLLIAPVVTRCLTGGSTYQQ
jgi:hypothetical protein